MNSSIGGALAATGWILLLPTAACAIAWVYTSETHKRIWPLFAVVTVLLFLNAIGFWIAAVWCGTIR